MGDRAESRLIEYRAGQIWLADYPIRYAACDVAPCAVVKWDRRRAGGAAGACAWKRLSSSTFRARLRGTFESAADLPPDSPTRRALARETPPECGYFQAGSHVGYATGHQTQALAA